jgi:protoporphyrinogen oxidase
MKHRMPGGPPVVVIGGGLCGISAALHLRSPYLLLERESTLGGLARTEERDGFFFDRTGHWLHLRDPATEALVRRVLGDELEPVQRRARVFAGGALVPYPFQANVHGLPRPMAYDCLLGYVRSLLERGHHPEPRNFEQYILHHFGEGIARHFMIPYNTKLWGVHPREITSAWCQRFVPVPTLEQMIGGAIGGGEAALGYNVSFRYPRRGGIGALSAALASGIDPTRVRLGAEVESIDPARGAVQVGGEWIEYRALISTMPLPELVGRLVDPPAEVAAAAAELRWTSVRYLNVATRARPPADYHWVYAPDERLPFYRVGVFSAAMPSMAPPGCSSIYVELASRDRGVDPAAAVRALGEVGALGSAEELVFAEPREIKYAYVIFDERYESALARIHPYLERSRIYSRGRYGAWIYNAMEDSIMSGRETAALCDALPIGAVPRSENESSR